MAVHYTFDKDITLNDIRKNTGYEISKIGRAKYYTIKKDDNNWLQASLNRNILIQKGKSKVAESDENYDVPINFFIGRGYGGLLVKEFSLIFQSKFLTDTNIDDIIEIEEEMKRHNVENFGLFVTKSGYIVQTKEECDELNDKYDNDIAEEVNDLDFSFECNDNELEV